jgi:hypothetical protein
MDSNADNNQTGHIPEQDPSKAMDSKREVEQSNDQKTDQDFPGYPHYPAKEDIMDKRTDTHRVDADLEKLANGPNTTGVNQRFASGQSGERTEQPRQREKEDDEIPIRMGTDADVDEDDLAVLNSTNGEIGVPQNVSNEDMENDMDIPGTELDDENEAIGEEDEENNYYSLGGDRHESQEEDPYSGPDRGQS